MVPKDKRNLTIGDLISSILENKITHEINAPSVYFGYDSIGHSFFKKKDLLDRTDRFKKDYLRVIYAFLICSNIQTINPKSVWLKCKFEESKKIIQILDIGSNGSYTTKKKCKKFFKSMEEFNFGHFRIIKSPASFSWKTYEQDIETILEYIDNLEIKISELELNKRKKFFYNLENFLLLNSKSKLEDWQIVDCKSFLINTPMGNLKIFRSS